ncbi:hypothetical protein EVAR_13617_1 [Eumeta japonica]|uniref:Uncharacterized protein n=1 Tax=Eumeta variegata TaxID=151549 RepID=A0A4C1UV79_EUMVA|nr:hypothetical protein EVAR_13617_1 [Eumeta japonica]
MCILELGGELVVLECSIPLSSYQKEPDGRPDTPPDPQRAVECGRRPGAIDFPLLERVTGGGVPAETPPPRSALLPLSSPL